MGIYEILDEDEKTVCETTSEAEAKYIIYSSRAGEYIIRIPKDDIVVDKAVQKYESHIIEIKKKIFEFLYSASFDYNGSIRTTEKVMDLFFGKAWRLAETST